MLRVLHRATPLVKRLLQMICNKLFPRQSALTMNNEIRQLITVLNDALNASPTDLVALETIKAQASVALVRLGEFGNRLFALRAAYADDVDKLNAIPDPGAPVELTGLLDAVERAHQCAPVTLPTTNDPEPAVTPQPTSDDTLKTALADKESAVKAAPVVSEIRKQVEAATAAEAPKAKAKKGK